LTRTRLSVAIQTHPKRDEMARALQALLPESELVVDPDPTAYRSPWRTYREALARTPADATHRLVIQDDTEPCQNFLPALDLVIAARPSHPIVLFVSGLHKPAVAALMRACDRDEPFAVVPASVVWIPAVAVVWPAEMIAPILAWTDAQHYPVKFSADDEILGRACRSLGYEVLCTVPSLVEHPDEVESLTGLHRAKRGHDPNRLAWCMIDGDPLDVRWDT
jgi:hypothetical protein